MPIHVPLFRIIVEISKFEGLRFQPCHLTIIITPILVFRVEATNPDLVESSSTLPLLLHANV